jgi:hypothetical protein
MDRRNLTFLAAFALALTIAPRPAGAQQSEQGVTAHLVTGGSLDGPARVVLGALPQMTAEEAAQPVIEHPILHGMPQAEFAALKAQAAAPGSPSGAAPAVAMPSQPSASGAGVLTPAASTAFSGAGQGCGAGGSFLPSDMALAAGPQFIVQSVNNCVAVFDKTGVMQAGFPKNMNAFFGTGTLSAGVAVFDPRSIYDWVNNRYIVSAISCRNCFPATSSTLSFLNIAVSQTADPRGAWNIYHFKVQNAPLSFATGDYADFDTLGQDRKAIYVCFNHFNFSSHFVDSVIMMLPKGTMYAAGAVTSFNLFQSITLGGLEVDTIQPANVMNTFDNPRAEFMVASENIAFGGGACSSGCSAVLVIAIANPLGTPIFSGAAVATNTYSLPPSAGQPGSIFVDTGDVRITGEVTYAAGSLFFSLNTNGSSSGSGFSHVMWFQLRPFLDDTPNFLGAGILNEECYFCGTATDTYYGTLQPDPQGNVIMVFDYSDSATNVSSAYTGRRVTQAANTMHDPFIFLQIGAAAYQDSLWGDYTATAPDLTSTTSPSMWVAASSAKAAHQWRSAIGNVRFKATDP